MTMEASRPPVVRNWPHTVGGISMNGRARRESSFGCPVGIDSLLRCCGVLGLFLLLLFTARTASAAYTETVSAGELHSCAIRTEGTPACWGWNHFGQADPGEGFTLSQISAGSNTTCGIKVVGGGITCWGPLQQHPTGAFTQVSL